MKYVPATRDELFAAAEFYEVREPGLGVRFLLAVDGAVELIEAHPHASPVCLLPEVRDPVRQRRVPPFPFLVLYVLEPEPLIVAVAHSRRRPGYWRARLPAEPDME